MPAISRMATTDSFGEGGHVPRSFGWSETNATPCGGAGTPLEDWAATYSPLECDGRSFFTLQEPESWPVPPFDIVGSGPPQPTLLAMHGPRPPDGAFGLSGQC